MESYIKTLARQMNIKFNYEKKLECVLVNEEEFNMLINKINKGLNGLEERKEICISYSVEVELRKLDIQVEIKRIDAEKDKSMSKIESITELLKNKIISFEEYKEMMMSF